MRNKNQENRNNLVKSLLMVCLTFVLLAPISCGDDDDSTDTEGSTDITEAISEITVEVHDSVQTILVVSWTQEQDFDDVKIWYTFENDEWFETPSMPRSAGDHEQVVLGIPEDTEVTMHLVATQGEDEGETDAFTGTTGSIPSSMPRPTMEVFDESLASPNRWLFGSVDDTSNENDYYGGPFWLYILDRQGRIVWYYVDQADNPILGFPRISRDGRYVFAGTRTPWADTGGFVPRVIKMTLDMEYFDEDEMPLSDNVDQTDDGSFLFNTGIFDYSDVWLMEYLPNGSFREVWNCSAVFGTDCYSNTVNWNPLDDTVLMSFPYLNTVVEIDRQTGDMVGQYGDMPGSYTFDSDLFGFGFQHFANITPEGTLMVSSHIPGVDGKHAFMEFEIDRENEVLKEEWIYREGDEWAMYMGEAHRVPNGSGNVLANYGTGGVIKEITPSKHTAWYVKWDAPFTDDRNNKMVGHCTLFDDLYALLQGPEK